MATNATSKNKTSAARSVAGSKARTAAGGKSTTKAKARTAASSRKSRKEKAAVAKEATPAAAGASQAKPKSPAKPAGKTPARTNAKEGGQPKPSAKAKPGARPKTKPKAKAKGAVPSGAPKPPPSRKASSGGPVRVLAAHRDVGALRQIREAVTGHFDAEIDTSPLAERAFELALQRDYQLFFLDADLAEIRGELLYEMIEKAYRYAGQPRFAPAVAYIFDTSDSEKDKELRRDARVKGVLSQPLREDKIAEVCREVLPARA